MPRFVCLLGDVKEMNLERTGSFITTDTKGRNWYCRPASEKEFNEFAPPSLVAMMQAQQGAHAQGFSSEGMRRVNLLCEQNELTAKLGAID
ncbi:hypothetical protein VT84_34720 [Gemmata sp. SH-PL17]|uniref:hypothetical protein n=1 Tax=Gemmata sp. SH-PL17 TaxID=1630693 RepID=UPI00078C7EAB|nr:hypothetical protein [Gemmata sp. SH-PL17]AMV29600.1 hypothetical protein VT84_34720 [Gemmata sp. SH-PL17]